MNGCPPESTGRMARPRRRGRRGFTLIELLIVLAIITLLVALLLPALRKARLAAETTQCANNQRQILTAMRTYLVSHDELPRITRQLDAVPPFETEDQLRAPWYLAPVIYHIDAPPRAHLSAYVNFGKLWKQDLFDDIKSFYCPTQTHPAFSFDTEINPWPPEFPERIPDEEVEFKFWNDVFSSYTRRLGLSFIKFDNVGPGMAITADVNMFPSYAKTHHDADGFNTAYSDGSVKYTRDPWFYEEKKEYEELDFYDTVRHCLEVFERLDR